MQASRMLSLLCDGHRLLQLIDISENPRNSLLASPRSRCLVPTIGDNVRRTTNIQVWPVRHRGATFEGHQCSRLFHTPPGFDEGALFLRSLTLHPINKAMTLGTFKRLLPR